MIYSCAPHTYNIMCSQNAIYLNDFAWYTHAHAHIHTRTHAHAHILLDSTQKVVL